MWWLSKAGNCNYSWMEKFIDLEEVGELKEYAETLTEEDGNVFTNGESELNDVRRSSIKWFEDFDALTPVYRRIDNYIKDINARYFNKHLYFIEPLQYTVYNESNSGFYTTHYDCRTKPQIPTDRKLSFTIQLSDPSEYDGGELVLYTPKEYVARKDIGSIIVFDSSVLHEVKPVTRGTRISLVGWVSGPQI
jgi:PKHD-type hydroxylase